MIHDKIFKKSLLFGSALFLFFLFIFNFPVEAKLKNQKEFQKQMKSFKEFYIKTLQDNGIVGSSFVFLHDNELFAQEFYGLANKEQNRPVDKDTIYHWASITKTFCGIAVMQLRDRGLLKLDDPITEYIPELKMVHNPFGNMDDITIRHLMCHSGGFRSPTWPYDDNDTKPWYPHEPLHWEQLVAMFPYTEIFFMPGTKWQYSNLGTIFLGRVIELLTTDDWEVYIDKNIFKPLEMYRSYFDHTPYHLMKHKAQSYNLINDELTPADPDVNTGITVSNGGLKCPFGDFIKYVNFLMGDPEKQAIYDMVLKRSSLEEMWQPQIPIENRDKDFPGENRKDAMGLNYFIEDNFNQHFIGHSGGQNAFITHFYLQPDTKTAYIVGFNTLATGNGKSTRDADRLIKEYLFKNVFPLFQ